MNLKIHRRHLPHLPKSLVIAFAIYCTLTVNGQDRELDRFMTVDDDVVSFPDMEQLRQASETLSARSGEWRLSVSQEQDRQVLRAESGDKLVTQSITPNAVHKRFVFDMKQQRFEPMRQEIRIENTNENALKQIEELTGVAGVKRYQNLGFAIVKVNVDVNPVEVLRTLREVFASEDSRILTGFFDDEPM